MEGDINLIKINVRIRLDSDIFTLDVRVSFSFFKSAINQTKL